MAAGLKYLSLPKALWQAWPEVMQKNGLQTEVFDEGSGVFISPQGQRIPYCSGGIAWNGLEAGVVAQRFRDDVGFLTGTNASANEPLLDAVDRIFFASGAKREEQSRFSRCKILYAMKADPDKECIAAIREQSSIEISPAHLIYPKQGWQQPPDFRCVISKRGVNVGLFTGLGYDADAHQDVHYIALDYQKGFVFNVRAGASLLAEVESILRRFGGKCVDMIDRNTGKM